MGYNIDEDKEMLAIGNFRYTTGANFVKRAYKCNPPKLSDTKGATWDVIGKLQGDIDVLTDTTWGAYAYFTQNNQWYKFKIS